MNVIWLLVLMMVLGGCTLSRDQFPDECRLMNPTWKQDAIVPCHLVERKIVPATEPIKAP